MTAADDIRARIEAERLVAIIRTDDLAEAERIVALLDEVGVTVIEFSLSGSAALPFSSSGSKALIHARISGDRASCAVAGAPT